MADKPDDPILQGLMKEINERSFKRYHYARNGDGKYHLVAERILGDSDIVKDVSPAMDRVTFTNFLMGLVEYQRAEAHTRLEENKDRPYWMATPEQRRRLVELEAALKAELQKRMNEVDDAINATVEDEMDLKQIYQKRRYIANADLRFQEVQRLYDSCFIRAKDIIDRLSIYLERGGKLH